MAGGHQTRRAPRKAPRTRIEDGSGGGTRTPDKRIMIPPTSDVSPCKTSTYENTPDVLASCLAFLTENQPDLASVVEAWEALPEAVKAGIVAMVKSGRD